MPYAGHKQNHSTAFGKLSLLKHQTIIIHAIMIQIKVEWRLICVEVSDTEKWSRPSYCAVRCHFCGYANSSRQRIFICANWLCWLALEIMDASCCCCFRLLFNSMVDKTARIVGRESEPYANNGSWIMQLLLRRFPIIFLSTLVAWNSFLTLIHQCTICSHHYHSELTAISQ